MTKFLIYFHYYYPRDEPLKIVLDFDPNQKAKEMLSSLRDELVYHIAEDEDREPNDIIQNIQLTEMYGLRPFDPHVWDQPLEVFVSKYSNEFVIINLDKPTIGLIEHLRPAPISGIRPRNIILATTESEAWAQRSRLELRLVTAFLRWMQVTRKRNWLHVVPLDAIQYNGRVWRFETVIPDSDSYTATWLVVLPRKYPKVAPRLYLKAKDRWIVGDVDLSHRWLDERGEQYFFVKDLTPDLAAWNDTLFLADWCLVGFWNYLCRELPKTFPGLKEYEQLVFTKDLSLLLTSEEELDDQDAYNEYLAITGRFFTWYLQRMGKDGYDNLQKLLDSMPSHRAYSSIDWQYCLDNLSPGSLEKLADVIVDHIEGLLKAHIQIYDYDVSRLREISTHLSPGQAKNTLDSFFSRVSSSKLAHATFDSILTV